VVPAPWMTAWFSKWFVGQTEVDDGTQLTFEGQGGEIWLPTVLIILLGWFTNLPWPEVAPPGLWMVSPLLLIPINLSVVPACLALVRCVCAPERQRAHLLRRILLALPGVLPVLSRLDRLHYRLGLGDGCLGALAMSHG